MSYRSTLDGGLYGYEKSTLSGMPLRVGKALLELLQNHNYAADLSKNEWEFATELDELEHHGLSKNDLKWMVGKGWLKQRKAFSHLDSEDLTAECRESPEFSQRSCFVLTKSGVSIACATYDRYIAQGSCNGDALLDSIDDSAKELVNSSDKFGPRWDAERNHLYFGNILVKQFKLPSPNQIAILSAFEEEQWPPRIDDPLTMSDVDPKYRLRYTIKSLNKHQKVKAIRFVGDGSGEGIIWESIPQLNQYSPPRDVHGESEQNRPFSAGAEVV